MQLLMIFVPDDFEVMTRLQHWARGDFLIVHGGTEVCGVGIVMSH
jgi:hypothetical protein